MSAMVETICTLVKRIAALPAIAVKNAKDSGMIHMIGGFVVGAVCTRTIVQLIENRKASKTNLQNEQLNFDMKIMELEEIWNRICGMEEEDMKEKHHLN